MRYYPVFLNLEGKRCLVVGAGGVGRRKITGLLDCAPAEVLVVDIRPADDELAPLLSHPALRYENRPFTEADLDGRFLVIASTSDEALNWRISDACKARGLPCNIVDQPEKCSFIVPAVYTQGDLTLAVSTGGASPAFAKRVKEELTEHFGAHYAAFLVLMSRLRPLVLARGESTDANTALFRGLIGSPLLDRLREADREGAEDILRSMLPAELSSRIGELLDGLV